MKKIEMVFFAIVLLSFLLSFYLYPQVPEKMASHWNFNGQVDGYLPRSIGLFLIPAILGGLAILFITIPRIDPLKENIESFRNYYDRFVFLLMIFILGLQVQVLLWNVGLEVSPNLTFPVGLGILLFYLGILLENAKRNWFIGIRTPWTLSSEIVWEKTHKLGGKLFRIAGAIAMVGVLFQRQVFFFVLAPVIAIAAYLVIYSYLEYRKTSGI